MDVGRPFGRPGNVQIAPARRAGADEDGIPALGQQALQAVDPAVLEAMLPMPVM
jgi:hypothetical protein